MEIRTDSWEKLEATGHEKMLSENDFVEEFGEKYPEALEELKMVAMEQEPYDYNLHTRRMK